MSFKAMVAGFAVILAAGSVVAFAGEDHSGKGSKVIDVSAASDQADDSKVSGKRHKLSESDFKKVALSKDKVKTLDESAFRHDDEDEAEDQFADDDDDDTTGTGGSGEATDISGAESHDDFTDGNDDSGDHDDDQGHDSGFGDDSADDGDSGGSN